MKNFFLLAALSAITLSSNITVGNNIKVTRHNHKKAATPPKVFAFSATRNDVVASPEDAPSLPANKPGAKVYMSSEECILSWLDEPVSQGSSHKYSYYYDASGSAYVPNNTLMLYCPGTQQDLSR